jgi:HK97 family phage major capsid protein
MALTSKGSAMPTQVEQELTEKRNRLFGRMHELMNRASEEQRELAAEETTEFDRLEAEMTETGKALRKAESDAERSWRWEQLQEVAERRASLTSAAEVLKERIDPTDTTEYKKAFVHWLRYGRDGLDAELRHILHYGYGRDSAPLADGQRAQTITTTAGGYLIPRGFRAELIQAMKAYGGVRANARILDTDAGNTLDIPTVDDTSNVGRLLSINTAVTTTDIVFGQVNLDAYKYSSDLVLAPVELMQDSAFDMNGMVTSLLAERLGRITETHYTTGTGTNQPNGVVTAAATGVTATTGGATSVTADNIMDLFHSVDPAYRGGASFMMNDLTVASIRKLKTGVSGDNTYLWQPGLQAGAPDTLLGRPVIVNQAMAVMAANAHSILFGNFQNYWIRDVLGVRFVRLDERYADSDQVGFVVFLRTDGDRVGPSGSIKAFVNSAT